MTGGSKRRSRIVVDSNVFVSGTILKPGKPFALLEAWRSGWRPHLAGKSSIWLPGTTICSVSPTIPDWYRSRSLRLRRSWWFYRKPAPFADAVGCKGPTTGDGHG